MASKKLHGEFVLSKKSAPNEHSLKVENISAVKAHTGLDHHSHTHQKVNFLTSFCRYPEGVVVENQDVDEEVVLILRRHFIVNLPWILISVLLLFSPLFIGLIIPFVLPFLNLLPFTNTLILAGFYIAVVGYILLNFSIWYFHVGVITNKRIIDVDLSGILYRNVAETEIESVADVAYIQAGSIRSFFDYGDVKIQTEAIEANFEFDRVPHPGQVVKIIGDLLQKEGNE